jgi:hypothetical protein
MTTYDLVQHRIARLEDIAPRLDAAIARLDATIAELRADQKGQENHIRQMKWWYRIGVLALIALVFKEIGVAFL